MAELGPDSIARPGVAPDPGVRARASAAQFAPATDNVGAAQANLANDLQKTGAVFSALLEKRQDAEDQAFVDKYQLALNQRMTQAESELTNSPASLKPDFVTVVDRRFAEIQKQTYDELVSENNQYAPSAKGTAAANHAAMQLRSAAAKRTVINSNNQRVTQIYNSSSESVDAIARMSATNGDFESGLARVDSTIEGLRGVLAPDKFETVRDGARAKVMQMTVLGLLERGEIDKAQALVSRQTGFAGKGADETKRTIIDEAKKYGADPLVVLSIAGRESNFNPAARNSASTASGLFQFISETGKRFGLNEVASNSPVSEQARAGAQITAMNAEALRTGLGRPPQPGEIFLAHFLGDGEALRVLKSDPDAKLSAIGLKNSERVFAANPHIKNWTSEQLVAWADKEMSAQAKKIIESGVLEGRKDTEVDMPLDTAVKLSGMVQSHIDKRDRIKAATVAETFETSIINMASGNGSVFARYEIESSPDLPENLRNTLLRQYDSAIGDYVKLTAGWTKFSNPDGGDFNPFSKEDRDIIDRSFVKLGGDQKALNAVLARTGYVPPAVTNKLRADLLADDPQKVQGTLTLAANLIKSKPNTFAGQTGAKEIEDAAIEFTHRVNDLGYTAEQASVHYINSLKPEFKEKLAKIKGEDITKIAKDNLTIGQMESAFDRVPILPFTDPKVGMTQEQRQSMFNDYNELFRERYAEKGDVSVAKTLALAQLKKVWGVSEINGKPTLMRYPPEAMPALTGVADPSKAIADQLISDIKNETGQTVPRDRLLLTPTFGGETAAAYKSGRPAPYIASWVDDNGLIQFLSPGKAFVVDVEAMRKKPVINREEVHRKKLETGVLVKELEADRPRGTAGLMP